MVRGLQISGTETIIPEEVKEKVKNKVKFWNKVVFGEWNLDSRREFQ